MLRQIHIIYNEERVFSHTFALAFGNKEIDNVTNTIIRNIQIPNPDRIFSRRISDYQIFYKKIQNLYFFMVTDLIDSLDYIENILNKTIKKFKELFKNIEILKESNIKKKEYIDYLIELQIELHCKISIIGPSNAGKSTLYTLMTNQHQEKWIMNFAKVSILNIYSLKFDVWDFQLKDNFSLLWPKLISGSDLVIFVFNASNYNLNVLDYFLTLNKKESNLSRFIIIANKTELINEEVKRKIKNDLNLSNINFLSFNKSEEKIKIFNLISNTLQLKISLPSNFNDLVNEAENLIKQKNFVKALAKYKELINIANSCQCFSNIDDFKKKVKELNQNLNEKSAIRKKIERKMKFAPPKQIAFTKEITVKILPKVQKPPDNYQKVSVNLNDKKPIPIKKEKEINKKQEFSNLVKQNEKKTFPEEMYSTIDEVPDEGELLQKMIQSRGSNLKVDLCRKFIQEMKNSLKRELTIEDLKTAVKIFLKHG